MISAVGVYSADAVAVDEDVGSVAVAVAGCNADAAGYEGRNETADGAGVAADAAYNAGRLAGDDAAAVDVPRRCYDAVVDVVAADAAGAVDAAPCLRYYGLLIAHPGSGPYDCPRILDGVGPPPLSGASSALARHRSRY